LATGELTLPSSAPRGTPRAHAAPRPVRREPWPATQVLICAGLFLVSSDRFLALNFGALTLKPSYVFFGGAFFLVVTGFLIRPLRRTRPPLPGLIGSLAALLAVNLLASAFTISKTLAVQQIVTIVGGAIVPFACIAFGVKNHVQLQRAMSALVAGTVFAATFGFYQFAAPYLGLSQGLAYAGTIGGVGRITAFSYEPAFWVFHVELTLAILIGDVLARRRRLGIRAELLVLYLIASLVLANARAGFLSFPLLVFLVLRTAGDRRRLDRRAARFVRLAVPAAAVIVVIGLPLGVNLPAYLVGRVQSVTNLQEAESNAIRVVLYREELELVTERPWLGYGPGTFGVLIKDRVPFYATADPHAIVANNLVLQTLLDAGLLSLPPALWLIWAAYLNSRRSPSIHARILLSGVTAGLVVNSMLAAFFWDMRLWVVIGLAYAAARVYHLERAGPPINPRRESPVPATSS
jgi:O-Antigen ligase